MDKELSKPAKWGADIIIKDVAQNMVNDTDDIEKVFKKSNYFLKTCKNLLKRLEDSERKLKATKKYTNANATALYVYYSLQRHGLTLQKTMIEAYAFISSFREWLIGEKIEYLIEVEKNSKEISVLRMNLLELINYMSLGVSAKKGFRLSVSGKNTALLNDLKEGNVKHASFENDLKRIEQNIIGILEAITQRASKKKNQSTIRVMNKYGIIGKKLNRGFVTETAIQMYAALGPHAKNETKASKLARYYLQTRGNLPGFRGGDINKNIVQKLMDQSGDDERFAKNVSLQVKRVKGLFGATVIEINTLKYELFNLSVMLFDLGKKGPQTFRQTLQKYFTAEKTPYKTTEALIKDRLQTVFSESLSSILNQNNIKPI